MYVEGFLYHISTSTSRSTGAFYTEASSAHTWYTPVSRLQREPACRLQRASSWPGPAAGRRRHTTTHPPPLPPRKTPYSASVMRLLQCTPGAAGRALCLRNASIAKGLITDAEWGVLREPFQACVRVLTLIPVDIAVKAITVFSETDIGRRPSSIGTRLRPAF